MSNALALSDVLARSVSVEWHEAIAVVRDVAEHMLGTQTRVVPELHQIHITSTGEVDVIGGRSSDEPIRRLGQLLQATLGQSDPPVQLRLVISQATAPSPPFDSIDEFDDALGYYERPDRRAVLRALYLRAEAAHPAADLNSTLTLDSIAPLSDPDQPQSAQKAPVAKSKGRSLRLVAGALSFLIVCGIAAQYGRTNGVTPGAGEISVVARRISGAVGAFIQSGLSAVAERVGLGRLIWSETAGAEPAPAAAEPPPSAAPPAGAARSIARPPAAESDAQSAPAPSTAARQPLLAFDLERVPAVLVPPDVPADAGNDAVAPRAAQPGDRSAEGQNSADAFTVYSAESAEVAPPVGIRPQLPRDLPPDIRPENLVSIEVIVLSDGTVESVKLLGEVHNVHDLMWLSAVKAWQFSPAMKDGRPVNYRKTVWIAPQP